MTRDDFIAWKDASSWFFDALIERQKEHKDQADNLLLQFAAAPSFFTDRQKELLISQTQRGAMIADICAIGYEEIVEVEDDTTNE